MYVIQLCLALIGLLIVFVAGIYQTDVFAGCVVVAVLIHYFTLVAFVLMGAVAFLLFLKLVTDFDNCTKKRIVITSLICWRKLYSFDVQRFLILKIQYFLQWSPLLLQ